MINLVSVQAGAELPIFACCFLAALLSEIEKIEYIHYNYTFCCLMSGYKVMPRTMMIACQALWNSLESNDTGNAQ